MVEPNWVEPVSVQPSSSTQGQRIVGNKS
ncbi:hypothetical protein LINGRAHAP2_LOCUS14660, partial [Linum grandiflorum]